MGSLLFSPSGRTAPGPYMQGMLILGVIGAIISLLPLVSAGLSVIGSIVGLVLLYCVIALGIKRSHDAGKSGWFSVTHLLLLFGLSFLITWLLGMVGLGPSAESEAALEAAGETGDLGAVLEIAGEVARESAIPSAIATFVAYAATAFIVNMLNPPSVGTNAYDVEPVSNNFV